MKFAITPLENKQVVFWEDIKIFKENDMKYYQDFKDDNHGDWYRIYSNYLLMPNYAKQLYEIAEESYRFEDGYFYPSDLRKELSKNESIILHKREMKDCCFLEMNDGSKLYFY